MPSVRADSLAVPSSAGSVERLRHVHRLSPSLPSLPMSFSFSPACFRLAFFFPRPSQPGHTIPTAFPATRLALPLAAWAVFPAWSRLLTEIASFPAAGHPGTRRTPVGFPGPQRLNQPQTGLARAPRTWGARSSGVVVSRGCRGRAAAGACGRPGFGGVAGAGQHGEERADLEPFLGAVAERAVGVHGGPGAASGPGAGEVARGFQSGHDGLHGALGDAGGVADVADPGSGVAGDLHEHVPVPGQQRPAAVALARITHTP